MVYINLLILDKFKNILKPRFDVILEIINSKKLSGDLAKGILTLNIPDYELKYLEYFPWDNKHPLYLEKRGIYCSQEFIKEYTDILDKFIHSSKYGLYYNPFGIKSSIYDTTLSKLKALDVKGITDSVKTRDSANKLYCGKPLLQHLTSLKYPEIHRSRFTSIARYLINFDYIRYIDTSKIESGIKILYKNSYNYSPNSGMSQIEYLAKCGVWEWFKEYIEYEEITIDKDIIDILITKESYNILCKVIENKKDISNDLKTYAILSSERLNQFNVFPYNPETAKKWINSLIINCKKSSIYFITKQNPELACMLDSWYISKKEGWEDMVDIILHFNEGSFNMIKNGDTLLLHWSRIGFLDGVKKLLLSPKIDRSVNDINGNNFLDLLLKTKFKLCDIFSILRECQDLITGKTIYIVSKLYDEETINYVISVKPTEIYRDDDGVTAYHIIAKRGILTEIKLPDIVDNYGFKPSDYCISIN